MNTVYISSFNNLLLVPLQMIERPSTTASISVLVGAEQLKCQF